MPPELARAVRRCLRAGTIEWQQLEIESVSRIPEGFRIASDGGPVEVEHLVCGFPAPTRSLEWAPGLYVTGALAELELGPTAPNIAGARSAGERLARAAA
jgi:hypothetical protein